MKILRTYFCLLLLLIGSAHIHAINDAKLSITELDAAFISAVKADRFEEVERLIKEGANIHTPIPYTDTFGDCDWDVETSALLYAVRQNQPSMVRVLLKSENSLHEALDIAIDKGYPDVVEELLKGGADIEHPDKNNNTPLILAVQQARAISEFSLQAQAKANSRWSERRKIIQILLKRGADVSHVNNKGRTALMEAVIEHDFSTVKSLLEIPAMHAGSFFGFGTAPINYADNDGNTALILAIQHIRYSYINNQEYNICFNSQNIINTLLETPGIDPYHANNDGETAITLLEEFHKKMNQYPY